MMDNHSRQKGQILRRVEDAMLRLGLCEGFGKGSEGLA